MFTGNVVCSAVVFQRLFRTTFALAFALELDDQPRLALRRRVVDVADPVELLGVDELGDARRDAPTLVWYGISRDDDLRPRRPSSISAFARTLIEPRPVVYASWIPWRPRIDAARREVGALHELHQVLRRRLGVIDDVVRWRR